MAQTTDRQLAAQKRAEARQARRLARSENQWAQGSLLVFVLVYNLLFQLVLVPLGKAIWAAALDHSPAHYIISDNLGLILRSPLIWLALLVIGVGYSFWALLLGVAGVGLLFTGLLYVVGLTGEGVLDSVLTVQTEITSHRGYSAKAPENTLPSIQAAIDSGVSDYAEIDVQQTSDGVVVLTHDTSLKRCTGLDANVHDVTYEQLRTLDASKGYSGADAAQFAGTTIPTLEEVILLCKANGMKLNIEIKGATPTLEQETVRIIQENDFGDQCILTSLRYDALEKVKALDPTLKTGYIMAMGVGNYYDLAAADIFSVESTFVTVDMVNALHRLSERCVRRQP